MDVISIRLAVSVCSVRVYIRGQISWFLVVLLPPFDLPMRTQPPSFQRGNGPHSRFNYLLQPATALRIPRRVLQLEGGDFLSHTAHAQNQSESIPLETDRFLTTDRNELVNLAGRLRPFLPAKYYWLGQDDLKVVGTHPVDAGGFADVWVGKMGDRRIAIKSYRWSASADHVQIYEASNLIRCVTFTDNQPVEVPQ